MAGTDAMNPFCFPGFSLHDELAMMVDSGLTPLVVVQSATINPAKVLAGGESKLNARDFSVVEPGKIANLVLLRADPLADVHNTTKIQAVWLRGKYFDQAAWARLLETTKQAAKH
jgi:imidazolonepropionase-like amidohydrolase